MLRRTFLKAIAVGVAGLLLPTDAAEAIVEPARRVWALDRTQFTRAPFIIFSDHAGGPGEYVYLGERFFVTAVTADTLTVVHNGPPQARSGYDRWQAKQMADARIAAWWGSAAR